MKSELDNKEKSYKGWVLTVVGAMAAMVIGVIIAGIPGLLLGIVIGLIIAVILKVKSGKNAAV